MESRDVSELSSIRGSWGPERKKKGRTIKPAKAHKQEIIFHVNPEEAFNVAEKATQLSEFELQEYKEAFAECGGGDSGSISTGDLTRLLTMLRQDPTESLVRDLVAEKSREHGSGVVLFSEFVTLMAKIPKDEDDEDLREAFSILDPQHTGSIGPTEIEKVMKSLGHTLSEEELRGMVREADTTGDGRITFKDFCQIMKGT